MAKIQLKSDNITPFGGLYSIFNQFNRSGVRETVDSFLGRRSLDPKAFSYGDVFASLFANYLCGGDCIEDVMATTTSGLRVPTPSRGHSEASVATIPPT